MPGLACLAVIAVSIYFRCYRLFEPWSGGHNDVGQDLFSLSKDRWNWHEWTFDERYVSPEGRTVGCSHQLGGLLKFYSRVA